MRILVIGRSGQLAKALAHMTLPVNWEIYCAGRPEIDVTNINTILAVSGEYLPDLIINTAAYTAVDKAESEQEQAVAINVKGAGNVAMVAQKLDIPCFYFSTDYIFDGESSRPYREDDKVNPLSVYGHTKEAGEGAVRTEARQHIILRTSWIYSPYNKNFLKTMLELMANREEIKVVNDQFGSPSSALDLALAVKKIISNMKDGEEYQDTYHLTGTGITSWYEFAMTIQQMAGSLSKDSWSGMRCKIRPVSTAEYQSAAQRPLYSVLDNSKVKAAFGLDLPGWKDSLGDCIKQIYPEWGK